MDAVMYCVSALEKFEKMPLEEVQQIGFEIGRLGTRGLHVNSSEGKYTLNNWVAISRDFNWYATNM